MNADLIGKLSCVHGDVIHQSFKIINQNSSVLVHCSLTKFWVLVDDGYLMNVFNDLVCFKKDFGEQ